MHNDQFSTVTSSRKEIDAGLRSYMNSIYMRMSAGVLVTALVALAVGTTPALFNLLMGGPQAYVFMFAPLAITWFGFNPNTMSSSKLQLSFFAISACYGITFSIIAVIATANAGYIYDVARAFFITVGMFAGLSLLGYTTKKNLSGMGSFMFMGMIGILIMGVVNMFMASSAVGFIIDIAAIIVFSGLTAYQTQMMKECYNEGNGTEANSRMAWFSALNLYISFIAIFQTILSLLNSND